MTTTKTYKVKSSAVRAAKKDHGEDWNEMGTIQQNEAGEWFFELTPVMKTNEELAVKNMVQVEINQSTTAKPCNFVWEMAIEMNAEANKKGLPAPKRSEVINACVAAGVAYNTARTQYQAWFKASKA